MKLYRKGRIDENIIEKEMNELQDKKNHFENELEKTKRLHKEMEITDNDIKELIDNFKENLINADAQTKKRVVQTLFNEIRIFPKNGEPWERILEVKGTYIPLTRVNVASPRGFEPLLSRL